MRRFWKEVGLEQGTYGHGIRLDGRMLKTPKQNELYLPTMPLAQAVKAEWEAVSEQIDPLQMPMTMSHPTVRNSPRRSRLMLKATRSATVPMRAMR
jgi:chaperone required for assembly of F1-ATPase